MIALRDYDVIFSPVVTEKSTAMSENNQIVFNVRKDSSKSEIKIAVEALFGVKVLSVNTLRRKGKLRRVRSFAIMQKPMRSGRNLYVLCKDVKRAVVTLAKGHSIDISASF
ncbi:LSU ribosomal protein L23p (L23Ae) [Liberibacter crescens BT-1]|uniref:Large ribosomal subunit protein uL23 n=1 Tax=Liberibacter crescens (strain BT-1) TaxID=1215343 RepID=L0ESB9_LIBCB|nr:50S ribosomal protein L23 [Liberibacter crescens]AGA64404.1 LSU ribosomal protein L23p (L23Ae) [Liberibacter crescens BT-1]AMC12587.1 50S ribosomal protein L23 [Liberibacter crescens]